MTRTAGPAADRIRAFAVECAKPGWDSYDAAPITAEVCERAIKAITALDAAYTFWSVPLVDGGIGFEGTGEWDGVDLKVQP